MINHFYDINKVKIYNGDCLQYIKKLYKNNVKVSLVITSPPYNTSKNALTRIIEYIFVIVRKDESKTFQCNKEIKSVSRTGQKYYNTIYNFIEAKNNDGSNPYNKATFSSDLVCALLKIYAKDKNIIFDPFLGTGTTAYAVLKYNQENKTKLKCLGAELSINQCKYATDRIDKDFSNVLKYR